MTRGNKVCWCLYHLWLDDDDKNVSGWSKTVEKLPFGSNPTGPLTHCNCHTQDDDDADENEDGHDANSKIFSSEKIGSLKTLQGAVRSQFYWLKRFCLRTFFLTVVVWRNKLSHCYKPCYGCLPWENLPCDYRSEHAVLLTESSSYHHIIIIISSYYRHHCHHHHHRHHRPYDDQVDHQLREQRNQLLVSFSLLLPNIIHIIIIYHPHYYISP